MLRWSLIGFLLIMFFPQVCLSKTKYDDEYTTVLCPENWNIQVKFSSNQTTFVASGITCEDLYISMIHKSPTDSNLNSHEAWARIRKYLIDGKTVLLEGSEEINGVTWKKLKIKYSTIGANYVMMMYFVMLNGNSHLIQFNTEAHSFKNTIMTFDEFMNSVVLK